MSDSLIIPSSTNASTGQQLGQSNTELHQSTSVEHTESQRPKYYACDDPNRPVCRAYVNQGRCHKKKHCNFYHPRVVTQIIEKRARREPGRCYCGSRQKTIICNQTYRHQDGVMGPEPMFFVVCSRTGKSIKKCM